jgi:hypothetical protein
MEIQEESIMKEFKTRPVIPTEPCLKPLVVIAGNYRQFVEYRREHPESEPLIYAGEDGMKIRGIENRGYVEIGTCYELKSLDAIKLTARIYTR